MSSSASSADEGLEAALVHHLGADTVRSRQLLQALWSGYGQIVRYQLAGGLREHLVVKVVRSPASQDHPRGWNTDRGHARKIRSYGVENHWYQEFARRCDETCRVPNFLGSFLHEGQVVLILEDLDRAGFPLRRSRVTPDEVRAVVSWLASFHAKFLGAKPEGLWEIGCYWHLATRPDEWKATTHPGLKQAAPRLDKLLCDASFQTIVHGDAKLANFCFSKDARVAAVDFQYVGGGVGVRDLAYFLSSCLDESECAAQEETLLATYFDSLRKALQDLGSDVDFSALESEWRELYPVAWTDFLRFLHGWQPGHWKIHSYSERLMNEVLQRL